MHQIYDSSRRPAKLLTIRDLLASKKKLNETKSFKAIFRETTNQLVDYCLTHLIGLIQTPCTVYAIRQSLSSNLSLNLS